MKQLLVLLITTSFVLNVSSQTVKTTTIKGGIAYESPKDIPSAPNCNPSEMYLKKKVKALMANTYRDYPYISVDITSFKGQKGYTDKKDSSRIVYPYKIEVTVYVKKPVTKDGKLYNEVSKWEYDAVYEYATRPGKKCEFYMVPSSKSKLISKDLY